MSQELNFAAVRDLIIEAIEGEEQSDGISWKGWCPGHIDKRENGNKSLVYYANPSMKHGFKCLSHNCSDSDIKVALTKQGIDFYNKGKQEPSPIKKSSAREKTEDEVLYPMPDPIIPENQRKLGDIVYEYTMLDGRIAFLVHRYIDDVGHKQVRPFFAKKKTNEEGISSFVIEALVPPKMDRPLYNLFGLANAKNKKPVLMVEGEKTAEFARKLLPGYVVMTWSGGTSALSMSDWSSLKGLSTEIFLWPDNDEAGIEAMQQIAAYAKEAGYKGAGFKLVFEKILANKPGGWDLADLVEEEHQWMYRMLDKAKDYKATALIRLLEEEVAIIIEYDLKFRKINIKGAIGVIELELLDDKDGNIFYNHYRSKAAFMDAYTDMYKKQTEKGFKETSKAELWFTKTQTDIIAKETFDPSTTNQLIEREGILMLNLFTGFIKLDMPKDPKDYTELTDLFIKQLIPTVLPNEKECVYLLDYIAHLLQRPAEKPHAAIILVGKPKAGKSSIIEVIKHLIGKHLSKELNPFTNFNANQAASLFMYKDEFFINVNDRKSYSTLKNIITAPDIAIERKGLDTFETRSYHRYIFSTNLERSIVLDPFERRLTILRLNDTLCNNKDFWNHFHKDLLSDNNQLAVLREYLTVYHKITTDLSLVLDTEAKETMIDIEEPAVNWFYGLMQTQIIHHTILDLQHFEPTEELYRTPVSIASWVLVEAAKADGVKVTISKLNKIFRSMFHMAKEQISGHSRDTITLYGKAHNQLIVRQESVIKFPIEVEMRASLETWVGKKLYWPHDILLPMNVIKADFGKKKEEPF